MQSERYLRAYETSFKPSQWFCLSLTWLLDNELCGRGVVCVTERCCGTWPVSTVWPSSAALRCGARARAAYQVALAHYVCGARARVMGGAGAMFKSAIILPFVLALDGRPVLRC